MQQNAIAKKLAIIYAVANTKGGAGKTTNTLNLAIARALKGLRVLLVNADVQKTANIALANRAALGIEPTIACVHYPNGPELRAQVKHQAALYDEIWIDCGGQDSPAMRAALTLADVVLIPFQPRSYDAWAMADVANLIIEARSMRDDLLAFAYLNQADPGEASTDNREAAEYIATLDPAAQIELIDAPLRRRKAFANAGGHGLSVLEPLPKEEGKPVKPLDRKAIAELNALLVKVCGPAAAIEPAAGIPVTDDIPAEPVPVMEHA